MTRYFTSDLHLNDWRLGEFNPHFRPFETVEEQNQTIIDNINNMVGPKDELYILGDVSLDDQGASLLENIVCQNRTLIIGNHDASRLDLLKPHFDLVVPELELDLEGLECYLNHYPKNARENRFNIVGHIHALWKVKPNMVNVSTDAWHFRPVPEDEILLLEYAMEHFYDENVFYGTGKRSRSRQDGDKGD